jgi:hypothetical protein
LNRIGSRLLLAVSSLAAGLLLPAPSAGAQQNRARTSTSNLASVTRGGVRVTASIPRHAYPRAALVSVWIGLRNVSNRTVYVPGACRGPTNPHVVVLNVAGQTVYPPLIPVRAPAGPPVMGCLAARPRPLRPDAALHWRQYALLRGSRIVVSAGTGRQQDFFGASRWLSVVLHVQLTARDAPTLTVSDGPPVTLTIGAAPGNGPFLLSDWWLCPGDVPANGAPTRVLTRIAGMHMAPPCADPLEWHGVVGRANHSIARFDYTEKQAPPTSTHWESRMKCRRTAQGAASSSLCFATPVF